MVEKETLNFGLFPVAEYKQNQQTNETFQKLVNDAAIGVARQLK
jgi:hypothetical protein